MEAMETIVELTTGKGKFLAVKIQEGARSIQLVPSLRKAEVIDLLNTTLVYMYGDDHQGFEHLDDYSFGKLDLLGPIKDLTEEQWREVVEPLDDDDIEGYGWEHYMTDEQYRNTDFINGLPSATESGKSLCEASQVYTVNPYGEKEPHKEYNCTYAYDYCDPDSCRCRQNILWQEAQERTGNYVLIKVNQ